MARLPAEQRDVRDVPLAHLELAHTELAQPELAHLEGGARQRAADR